jgi:hypothetical protein
MHLLHVEAGASRSPEPAAADAKRCPSECPNQQDTMKEDFERHRQPWTPGEIAKLHQLTAKGMSLRAISKALTRSEESIKTRAKLDKLLIAKKR